MTKDKDIHDEKKEIAFDPYTTPLDALHQEGGTVGTTDDPPIGGGSGSFFLDIPNIMALRFKGVTNFYNGTIPYQTYEIMTAKTYTSVGHFRVLTERVRPVSEVTWEAFNNIPDSLKARVKIWLKSDSENYPLDSYPAIIIDGETPGHIYSRVGLTLETPHPYKRARIDRYYFGSSSPIPNKTLRVTKWQILPPQNDQLNSTGKGLYEHEGADLYYFYVYFNHPHPEQKHA